MHWQEIPQVGYGKDKAHFFGRVGEQKKRQRHKGQATGNVINIQAFPALHRHKCKQEMNRCSGCRNKNCGELGKCRDEFGD
jgi:hypothetical protein